MKRAIVAAFALALWLGSVVAGRSAEPAPRAFYGINADPVWSFKLAAGTEHHGAQFAEMLRASRAGAVRMPIRWLVVEPRRGEWDFAAIDRTLALIPPEVEILATLMSVPTWANGKEPGQVEGWFDAYPPANLDDWARYVAKVVGRYQSRIRHWEIWNEQNGVDFYRPLPDARAYTELLKTAYRAAKQADPQCVVVLGGLQMNGVIANPWSPVKVENFLDELYRAGAGPFFDVCNTHPYVLPEEGAALMMQQTRATLAVMARHGDAEKPLWLTEVGSGAKTPEAEQDQARLLAETYTLAAREPQIARVFWFMLRDLDKDLLGPESSMGLFQYGGRAKPAHAAFAAAAGGASK